MTVSGVASQESLRKAGIDRNGASVPGRDDGAIPVADGPRSEPSDRRGAIREDRYRTSDVP